MEPFCSHREFDPTCRFCLESRELDIEVMENKIKEAFKDGGVRGVTHLFLALLNELK